MIPPSEPGSVTGLNLTRRALLDLIDRHLVAADHYGRRGDELREAGVSIQCARFFLMQLREIERATRLLDRLETETSQ